MLDTIVVHALRMLHNRISHRQASLVIRYLKKTPFLPIHLFHIFEIQTEKGRYGFQKKGGLLR